MHQNFNVDKMKANIQSMIKFKESQKPNDLKKTVNQIRKMSFAADQFKSNRQNIQNQMPRPSDHSNISNDKVKQKFENSTNSFKSNDLKNSKNSNTSLKISDIRVNNQEKSSHSNNSQINSSGKQNNQLQIKNQMESSMVSSQIFTHGKQKKLKKQQKMDSSNEENNNHLAAPLQIKKTKSKLFQFQNVERTHSPETQQQTNQLQLTNAFLKVPDMHEDNDKSNKSKKSKQSKSSKNNEQSELAESKPSLSVDNHPELEKSKFSMNANLDVHHDQIRPKRLSRSQLEPEQDKGKNEIRPKRPSHAHLEADTDKNKPRKSKEINLNQLESPPIKINTQSNYDQSKKNDSWSQSLSSQNSDIEKSRQQTKRSNQDQQEKMFKRIRRTSFHAKNTPSHSSLDNSKDKQKNKEIDKSYHYFKKLANRMNKKDKHKFKKQDHLIRDQDITIEFETPLLQSIIQIQKDQDEFVLNRQKTIDMIINQQIFSKLLNIDHNKEKQIIQNLCEQYQIDILQFVPNHAVNAVLEKDLTKVTLNTESDKKQDQIQKEQKPKKGQNEAVEAKMLKQLSDLSDLMHKADEMSMKIKSEKILEKINYKSNKNRYPQQLDQFSIDNSNKVNVVPRSKFEQNQLKIFDQNLKNYLNNICGELQLEEPQKDPKQIKKVPQKLKSIEKKEEPKPKTPTKNKLKSQSLHQITKPQLDNLNPQYASNSHFFKQLNQYKQNSKEAYDLKQNIIQFYLTARTAQKGMQMKSKKIEGMLQNYKNQIDEQYNLLDQTRDDHYNQTSYNFKKYLSEKNFKKKLFNYIINQVQKSERRVILNQFKSINVDVASKAPKPKISIDNLNSQPKPKINLPQINTLLV